MNLTPGFQKKTNHGYRLIACDGSDLSIARNPEDTDMYYLIRVKNGSGGDMVLSFKLPATPEFDCPVSFILTRKQTNVVKENPSPYKILSKSSPFDYLDLHTYKFYPMNFRVVRFAIAEASYECIITNLPIASYDAHIFMFNLKAENLRQLLSLFIQA